MGTILNAAAAGVFAGRLLYDRQLSSGSKTDTDTNETTLYTKTINPIDTSASSIFLLTARSFSADTTVAKNLRIRLGGTQLILSAHTATNDLVFQLMLEFRNSKSAQTSRFWGFGQANLMTLSKVDTTVDCTVSQDLTVTYQWGTAGSGTKSVALDIAFLELIQ